MGQRSRGVGMAAVIASAVVHAIVLVLLARHAATRFSREEQRTIQVALVSPSERPVQDRAARRPARLAGERPVQPSAVPSVAATVSPGVELPPGAPAPAGIERPVLRGLRSGCDPARLTRQEREDCEARRFAGLARAPPRLNLDPKGRFAENPEPFLSRRPEKGCRARLTGDVDPMGDDMNTRAGVTCVKRF